MFSLASMSAETNGAILEDESVVVSGPWLVHTGYGSTTSLEPPHVRTLSLTHPGSGATAWREAAAWFLPASVPRGGLAVAQQDASPNLP